MNLIGYLTIEILNIIIGLEHFYCHLSFIWFLLFGSHEILLFYSEKKCKKEINFLHQLNKQLIYGVRKEKSEKVNVIYRHTPLYILFSF